MQYLKLFAGTAAAAALVATPALGQSSAGRATATRAASALPTVSGGLRTATKLRHGSNLAPQLPGPHSAGPTWIVIFVASATVALATKSALDGDSDSPG